MKHALSVTIVAVVLMGLLAFPGAADAGGPQGGDRFLIYDNHAITEEMASVAYNTQRHEYLVVWQGSEIWGRRFSARGVPITGAVRISPTNEGAAPDVAYNSTADEYLVVWQSQSGVRGQRISWSGASLGGVITFQFGYLPPPGIDGYYYDQPAVAYASTSNHYLVAYRYREDVDNGSMILVRDCLSDGAIGIEVPIEGYSTMNRPEQPDLAYNRSRNEFLVVWQTFRATDVDVYARRVKMTGGVDVLGGEFYIAAFGVTDEIAPAVAAVPTTPNAGGYLVTWERSGDIEARAVSGEGVKGEWQQLAGTGWGEYHPAVAGIESTRKFLVTWTWIPSPAPPGMMQVQGRELAFDGAPISDTVYVGGGQVYDSAVAAGANGDALIAFDDNEIFGTFSRGIYGRMWGSWVYLPLAMRSS